MALKSSLTKKQSSCMFLNKKIWMIDPIDISSDPFLKRVIMTILKED